MWAGERTLARAGMALVRSPLVWAGLAMLRVLRLRWPRRTIRAEHANTPAKPLPKGPFVVRRVGHAGDLLLWVPRGLDSFLIDELTGGYGYSHATIDSGEVDARTGKPVMAEITIGQTVTRKFQDEYGRRPFVRVPLALAGVDVQKLAACIQSKMGQRYDALDALTLGKIDDPAKEVCSGLIADCLPDEDLRKIATAKKLGLLHGDAVSVHSHPETARVKAFVSPNGLAEYYGAPQGRKVSRPNTLVEPRPVSGSMKRAAALATKHQGWKVGAGLVALAAALVVVRRRR